MRWIFIIVVWGLMPCVLNAQELTDDMMESMVEMVDEHIDLNKNQERALLDILNSSYHQIQQIQQSNDVDVLKLQRMTQVQKEADDELKKVLSEEQYRAYQILLNGTDEVAPEKLSYIERVEMMADDLNLKDKPRELFEQHLTDLDVATQGILVMGAGKQEVGIQLLTEILVTDIELIRLLGRDKYAEFFDLRAEGALSDAAAAGSGSVEQVLMFADLAEVLKLSPEQTRQIIKQILDNEMQLQSIRTQYAGKPALMQEKLRLEEQKGLLQLQELLSEDQVETFLQLSGQ